MSADTFFDEDGGSTQLAAGQLAPLTDRVNNEPPILKGLSATETGVAMAVFFPLWFVVGGAFAFLFHHWQILMLMGVIGPMVSVWVSAGSFARLKRNRPDHYYLHFFVRALHRLGLKRSPFIVRPGGWSLGREMPEIVAKPLSLAQRLTRSLGL